ncbi:hypothetical protein QUF87_23015 [Lysinibacillus pakistanensis]|nr:hypothetical protein [Lysinibacillus pakistanensis]
MKVWKHTKKPQMLYHQRFVAFCMNIVYTPFYTCGVNVDVAVFLLVWFVLYFA